MVFLTAKTAPATVAAVPITPVATPLANECFFSHETILRICYNMLILSKKISRIASENIMKTKLIVVAGPTAVGKTALGIELAKRFNGEIISGDSQQVYRQLNIGTAKATPEEQAAAVHHLIDVRDVDESYSAYDFCDRGRGCHF